MLFNGDGRAWTKLGHNIANNQMQFQHGIFIEYID